MNLSSIQLEFPIGDWKENIPAISSHYEERGRDRKLTPESNKIIRSILRIIVIVDGSSEPNGSKPI